jgi:hypothetical protein
VDAFALPATPADDYVDEQELNDCCVAVHRWAAARVLVWLFQLTFLTSDFWLL